MQQSETGVLSVIETIARERLGYLEQMRAALKSGDDVQLKHYASKLCGTVPNSN
jgi:hypothetical protein